MDTVFWSYNSDLHSRQEQSSSHSFFFTFSPQPRVNPGLLDLTPAELSRVILPDWRATIPRSLFKSLNPLYAHLEQADVYTRREAGRLARL